MKKNFWVSCSSFLLHVSYPSWTVRLAEACSSSGVVEVPERIFKCTSTF